MRRFFINGLLVLTILFFNTELKSQDAKNKALFIYNFTKYVGWPMEAKTGEFVIGIVGNDVIYNHLKQITENKKIGNQAIVIQQFESIDDIQNAHILFVSYKFSNKNNLSAILNKIENKSTLVVTEREGSASRGSMINFVIRNNQVRFELNKKSAVEHKLQISLNLEKLAILV